MKDVLWIAAIGYGLICLAEHLVPKKEAGALSAPAPAGVSARQREWLDDRAISSLSFRSIDLSRTLRASSSPSAPGR